jgi:hypothetical protein
VCFKAFCWNSLAVDEDEHGEIIHRESCGEFGGGAMEEVDLESPYARRQGEHYIA